MVWFVLYSSNMQSGLVTCLLEVYAIEEAKKLAGVCTNEWCEAIEHVIDDLNNALFSISEPR